MPAAPTPDLGEALLRVQAWQWGSLGVSLAVAVGAGLLAGAALGLIGRAWPAVREAFQQGGHGRQAARATAWIAGCLVLLILQSRAKLEPVVHESLARSIHFVAILLAGWLAAGLWEVILSRIPQRGDRTSRLVLPFLKKLGAVVLFTLAGVTAFATVGTNVWGIVAGIGIGSIAIAFAAKDSVENVFGSVTVVLDMPFTIGDWVRVNQIEGIVEEINLRSTRIRTFEDSLITVPNSLFIRAAVENLGQRRTRRIKTLFWVESAQPDQLVKFCEALRSAIQALPASQSGSALVHLYELKEFGAQVQVVFRVSVDSYAEELAARQEALRLALEIAAVHGLRMPKEETP